jgi:uncharacterized membrane protein
MQLAGILYYYYYYFYTKIIPDNEPHATTIFTLSVSKTFFVWYGSDFLGALFFCRVFFIKWQVILLFIFILSLNYYYFIKIKKAKEIIKTKPILFRSKVIPVVFTLFFFLLSTSFIFWMGDYLLYLLDRCK